MSGRAKAGAGLPLRAARGFATGVPLASSVTEASATSSPSRAARMDARSAAWRRYSQLAQPAQANTEKRKSTANRTNVLRRTGKDGMGSIVRAGGKGAKERGA